MKFRRLNIEEIKALEPEFIQFLSANTVTASDWEKLKTEDPGKVEELIGVFSDIVFEKIIKDIQFLEFKTPKDIKVFHCKEDKIELRGLQYTGIEDIDLREFGSMMSAIQSSKVTLKTYNMEKEYQPDREQELFRMIQNGATISKDGQLFEKLSN